MTTIPCDQRHSVFMAAVAVCATCVLPISVRAASMPLRDFTALATRCAPSVPMETLIAVARTESGIDPWALHDNTAGVSMRPNTLDKAIADAEQQMNRGDSVDLGLMQINSANLSTLGMSVADALDPCSSLAGGATILRAAYGGGSTSADQQVALLMALSRYNTGTPFKGIMNGYVRTVIANDPANGNSPSISGVEGTAEHVDPNATTTWNVWGTASYAQTHNASWIVSISPDMHASADEAPNAQPTSVLVFTTPGPDARPATQTP